VASLTSTGWRSSGSGHSSHYRPDRYAAFAARRRSSRYPFPPSKRGLIPLVRVTPEQPFLNLTKRLMRKLLKKHGRAPRVLITDKLKSYAAANRSGDKRRTPPAQGAEQPGRKLAPANAGTREGDAPLQVGASSATVRIGPRSGRQPLHALPLLHRRKAEAGTTHPGKRDARSDAGVPCRLS
jgi:hypothetical protein